MKHIILNAREGESLELDLAELATYFEKMTDSRRRRGKIYPLGILITLILLAKLAGEDKPLGITEWIRLRKDSFVSLFNCKHNRMPCLNTTRWVLEKVINLEELEKHLAWFIREKFGTPQSKLTTLDGKSLRGTIPSGQTQGTYLLTAYVPEDGIALKQIEVGHKENEISAAPQLIEALDLKGKLLCGDAMHTQRQHSVAVLAQGGDYLWFVKNNQPTLLADVKQFFAPPQRSAGFPLPALPCRVAQSTNKGHGRLEKRTLTLMEDTQGFLDWPGVRQVFRLERWVKRIRQGTESVEVVYGITSCDPLNGTAEQMLHWTRAYWGIENGLHYRRDVTLREDATRIGASPFAQVMALLNNFVITLALKMGYSNLASARRTFNAQIASQLA
jgi:predicted transposase YbfD/YdcC